MFEGTNLQEYNILEQNLKTVNTSTYPKQYIFSFQVYLFKSNCTVIGVKKKEDYAAFSCNFSAVNAYQKTEGHTLLYEKVYSPA